MFYVMWLSDRSQHLFPSPLKLRGCWLLSIQANKRVHLCSGPSRVCHRRASSSVLGISRVKGDGNKNVNNKQDESVSSSFFLMLKGYRLLKALRMGPKALNSQSPSL